MTRGGRVPFYLREGSNVGHFFLPVDIRGPLSVDGRGTPSRTIRFLARVVNVWLGRARVSCFPIHGARQGVDCLCSPVPSLRPGLGCKGQPFQARLKSCHSTDTQGKTNNM